jgi:hypothetical protein
MRPITRDLTPDRAHRVAGSDDIAIPVIHLAIDQGIRLSLAAIWPNSGSERAFIFRIALLR